MISYYVLGSVDLRVGAEPAARLTGAKRLALLAYLMLASPRGPQRRDTLLGLFWPESNTESARNSLSNLIYQIRRTLGREVIAAAGDDNLQLTEGALWCDAVAFEQALVDGREEEALDLYRGELLAGFFVPGASAEVDHWLNAQREWYRQQAVEASRVLTRRAEKAGSAKQAIRWARRTHSLDPYDERGVRELISALDRVGDRAGAIRMFESFERMLRRELATEPSVETRTLIEAVRTRTEPSETWTEPGGSSPSAFSRINGTGPAELPVRTIAVLPFATLSSGAEDASFAAGLHDDLLTELSRISALRVIARTSVLCYRNTTKSVPEIAQELGTGSLLEAAVQCSERRLRLNVQLIDARNDSHRWVERYDRELSTGNIFDVQSELVEKIAASLEAELTPREIEKVGSSATHDLEAYRLHAQGRHRLNHRTEASLRQAVAYFKEALERDPEYAPAWAGLADAHSLLHDYAFETAAIALPQAERAARRALELDSTLAAPHASLGLLHSNRREGPDSIRELRQAIDLEPSYANAHNWLGWTAQCLGRRKLALDCARRAVELDPLERESLSNLSVTLLANGEADAALSEARRLCEFEPEWTTGPFYEALALYRLGRFETACSVLEGLVVPWVGPGPRGALALSLIACGEGGRANDLLREFKKAGDPFSVGLIYAARQDPDRAFAAFECVDNWGDYWPTLAVHLYFPTVFDPHRGDPRFAVIRERLNSSWGIETGYISE